MLYVLQANSKQLQTLRICFHETIYEADYAAGTLMPAFRQYLPHLPIETFELHMDSNSPWFGREVIQYLPNTLRRLYISRELLDEGLLAQDIDARYMASQLDVEEGLAFQGSQFLKTLRGIAEDDYICVGEDKGRTDFISMGGGKLGFIGYEYEPGKYTQFGNGQVRLVTAVATKTWMLTLNARLLDRERNMHLADFEGGEFILPPRVGEEHSPSTDKHSIAEKHGPIWVYAPPNTREIRAAAEELQDSVLVKRGNYYFGNENEAVKVFEDEPGVHPDDVLDRLWPDEISADKEDHWMTDHKPVNRDKEAPGLDDQAGATNREDGQGEWESERTAHWVENWIWFPCDKSYLKDEEREKFLSEREGEMLESLVS